MHNPRCLLYAYTMNNKKQGLSISALNGVTPASAHHAIMASPTAHSAARRLWLSQILLCTTGWGLAAPVLAASHRSTSVKLRPPAEAASAPVNKPEKITVTIATPNKAALLYLPLTIAQELGYFKAEGLELQLIESPSMVRAQQMVLAGEADVVSGWLENILALQPKSQWFQAFVLQGRTPQIALGISTKTMPKYKTLADLRGRRVGIIAPNTPTHTIAHAALESAGLRLGDMNFVSVGPASGAMAALRAGQVDALSYTDPLMTQLEQQGELRIVADTRTVRGNEQICGGEMPSSCLYARPEFLQQYPQTAQAITNAVVQALVWLRTAGWAELMRTVPYSYAAGDRTSYLASFDRMREAIALDGVIPEQGVVNTLNAMRRADPLLRTEAIDPFKSYTNAFAVKAKLQFKA
jgi:NitT/TauT family transport system substrate-binding protein